MKEEEKSVEMNGGRVKDGSNGIVTGKDRNPSEMLD